VWDFSKYNTNDWYSICVPFDLTRKQLLEIFGCPAGKVLDGEKVSEDKYPTVSTLWGVTHDYSKNFITLRFTENLTEGETWNFYNADGYTTLNNGHNKPDETNFVSCSGDDDIVMYAGCPYLIKPILPDEVTEKKPAKRVFKYSKTPAKTQSGVKVGDETVDGLAALNIDYCVKASQNSKENSGSWSDTKNEYYYFVGRYDESTVPVYAFFVAKNSKNESKFFREKKGWGTKWNPYNTIVGLVTDEQQNGKPAWERISLGDNDSYLKLNFTASSDFVDKLNTSQAKLMNMNVTYDEGDGTVTSIDRIDGKTTSELFGVASGAIYTLSGKRVNATSLSELPKGIYIVGGKKYVVK